MEKGLKSHGDCEEAHDEMVDDFWEGHTYVCLSMSEARTQLEGGAERHESRLAPGVYSIYFKVLYFEFSIFLTF